MYARERLVITEIHRSGKFHTVHIHGHTICDLAGEFGIASFAPLTIPFPNEVD